MHKYNFVVHDDDDDDDDDEWVRRCNFVKITLASGITVNRLTSVADLVFLTRGGQQTDKRGSPLPSPPFPSSPLLPSPSLRSRLLKSS